MIEAGIAVQRVKGKSKNQPWYPHIKKGQSPDRPFL
jgi:hypothetical protein